MTNPIDSLPATPETVGMPKIGDRFLCHGCGDVGAVTLAGCVFDWPDQAVLCWFCRSYDVEKVKP